MTEKPVVKIEPAYLIAGELAAGDLFVVLADGAPEPVARVYVRLANHPAMSGVVMVRCFGVEEPKIDMRWHTPVAKVEVLELRVRRIL